MVRGEFDSWSALDRETAVVLSDKIINELDYLRGDTENNDNS